MKEVFKWEVYCTLMGDLLHTNRRFTAHEIVDNFSKLWITFTKKQITPNIN